MRLWHQKLIPYLDRQRLLGQHRELCALRGRGWGRKHATVDYVFSYDPCLLVVYHYCVMEEMRRRGYHPDKAWENPDWRGNQIGEACDWADAEGVEELWRDANQMCSIIYPEHNDDYLRECIQLLKEKEAPIDWEKLEEKLYIKKKEGK